jgi:hypothetical protein
MKRNREIVTTQLAKTGLTVVYHSGDDGSYQIGKNWPIPRFTIQENIDCVKDNLTGLIWAKDANINGRDTWNNQITFCNNLSYGGHDDWRMPNRNEMASLMDYGNTFPALPTGHPFVNVMARYYTEANWADGWGDFYWTSTTYAGNSSQAFWHQVWDTWSTIENKTSLYFVWPVRGP